MRHDNTRMARGAGFASILLLATLGLVARARYLRGEGKASVGKLELLAANAQLEVDGPLEVRDGDAGAGRHRRKELVNRHGNHLASVTGVIVALSRRARDAPASPAAIEPGAVPCATSLRPLRIRGRSLSGIVEDGDTVWLEDDAARCRPLEHDMIVAFSLGDDTAALLAKVIHGVPGDRFHVVEKDGAHALYVNGEVARNSRGTAYSFRARRADMLKLYEHDYGGRIPQGAYLVLGNEPFGTRDGTVFGLISREQIIGQLWTHSHPCHMTGATSARDRTR
jgi:signal peptidase I